MVSEVSDPTPMQPSRRLGSERERVPTGFSFVRDEDPSPASFGGDHESVRSGVSSVSSGADDHVDDEPNIPLSCTGSLSSQAGGIGLVSLE